MYSFRTISSEGTDWKPRLLDEIRSVLASLKEQDELDIMRAFLGGQSVRGNLHRAMRLAGTPLQLFAQNCAEVKAAVRRGNPEIVFDKLSTADYLLYANMVGWLHYWKAMRSDITQLWLRLGPAKQELVGRILSGPDQDGEMPRLQPETSSLNAEETVKIPAAT